MTLRKFYKFLLNSKNYPEIVEDVRPDRAKNALLPTDMISESQVQDMLAGCRNSKIKYAGTRRPFSVYVWGSY